jgi:hypothetical protein
MTSRNAAQQRAFSAAQLRPNCWWGWTIRQLDLTGARRVAYEGTWGRFPRPTATVVHNMRAALSGKRRFAESACMPCRGGD